MTRTEKAARKLARDRYLSKLIDCIGAAVLAGYDEHARKMHEFSLDIIGNKNEHEKARGKK